MNMQAIGRKISALRKERDMTQVDLADKLGVTYQAVSSWERGNSMPDIAKLPDISQVLAVSIDELLDDAKATTLVKSVLTGQELNISDMETLAEVAPILRPSQVKNLAENSGINDVDMSAIADMAHHLNSETLKDLILRSSGIDSDIIAEIACHMNSEDLKEVALHCKNIDSGTIAEISCHMNSEDLKEVALHCKNIDSDALAEIACHMNNEDLADVAVAFVKTHGLKALSDSGIIDHMNEEDTAAAIRSAMQK